MGATTGCGVSPGEVYLIGYEGCRCLNCEESANSRRICSREVCTGREVDGLRALGEDRIIKFPKFPAEADCDAIAMYG